MAKIEKFQFQDITHTSQDDSAVLDELFPEAKQVVKKDVVSTAFEPVDLSDAVSDEDGGEEAEPEPVTVTLTEEELQAKLEAAEKKGFDKGRQEGLVSGRAEVQAKQKAYADELMRVVYQITGELSSQQQQMDQWKQGQTELLAGIARRVTESLTDESLEAVAGAIIAMIRDCMDILLTCPSVVALVHSDLAQPLEMALEQLPEYASLSDRLLIQVDDTLTHGQCKLRWDEGQAIMDQAKQWREIEQVIARHIASAPLPEVSLPPMASPPIKSQTEDEFLEENGSGNNEKRVMPEMADDADGTGIAEKESTVSSAGQKDIAIEDDLPEN